MYVRMYIHMYVLMCTCLYVYAHRSVSLNYMFYASWFLIYSHSFSIVYIEQFHRFLRLHHPCKLDDLVNCLRTSNYMLNYIIFKSYF